MDHVDSMVSLRNPADMDLIIIPKTRALEVNPNSPNIAK